MTSLPSKKRLLLRLFLTLAPLSMSLASCNDDVSNIGSSLVTDESNIVVDSTFTITGQSVTTGDLRSRTLSQLIGNIQARKYGSLSSDFVTQLMPSADFDTTGVTPATVDSLSLMLRFYSDKITGDSMLPMGVNVFALTRQLPEKLTSSFDPTGYYDPSSPVSSSVYSSNLLYSDSLEVIGVHIIEAKLPLSYGQEYVKTYRSNPELFTSPEAFASLFPGVYVANSFGSGRVTNIFNTRVVMYYHSNTRYTNTSGEERDTTIYYTDIIAASTPEVLTNNNLHFKIDPYLSDLASKEALLVGPLGYESRIKIPIDDVISSFTTGTIGSMGVVNSLSLTIPAEEITNDYGIEPPSHLLLVPSSDRDKFFDEQDIPDNKTSFIAAYDSTNGRYVFSGLRPYMMYMMEEEFDNEKREELSTFSLVPVQVSTETYTNSSYQTVEIITAVGPNIDGPTMARLKLDEAKLKLTYSTETVNF